MMPFSSILRHWTIWRAAWCAESGQELGSVPSGATSEFFPAVLEIQQAPPSPIGRGITWTIMVMFAAGTLWAIVGRIDIVATAQGKIIASG